MSKNVILFGAGASFGSDIDGTPPLGNNLYDRLALFNPNVWGKIESEFPNLANIFRQDFEMGMQELEQTNSHTLPPLQRAMAEYFFRFTPRPSNLYMRLAKKIAAETWDGALATLNYERLLELSFAENRIILYVNDPPIGTHKCISICLPHGCCHLFCDGVYLNPQVASISGSQTKFGGDIKVIHDPNEFYSRIKGNAVPPIMSYFKSDKTTSSCDYFIQQQRTKLSHLIANAERIAIIGVRPRPSDIHIWKPLSQTSAQIIYCSGEQGGNEFKNWIIENPQRKNDKILWGYFADCFDEICSNVGL